MNLAEIYSELERVYSAINKKYYDDKLPLAIITIQSKKVVSGDAYGWASKNRWIDINGKRYYELNITAEYLNLDKYDIISTLAHEMVHIYCWENDIKDTSRGNRYHNKRFKAEAEKRDLIINKVDGIGYSETALSDEFIEFIDTLNVSDVFNINRQLSDLAASEGEEPKKPRKPRPYYQCPSCGAVVRGKADISIMCAECEELFEYIIPGETD